MKSGNSFFASSSSPQSSSNMEEDKILGHKRCRSWEKVTAQNEPKEPENLDELIGVFNSSLSLKPEPAQLDGVSNNPEKFKRSNWSMKLAKNHSYITFSLSPLFPENIRGQIELQGGIGINVTPQEPLFNDDPDVYEQKPTFSDTDSLKNFFCNNPSAFSSLSTHLHDDWRKTDYYYSVLSALSGLSCDSSTLEYDCLETLLEKFAAEPSWETFFSLTIQELKAAVLAKKFDQELGMAPVASADNGMVCDVNEIDFIDRKSVV